MAAFGEDRGRFGSAAELQRYAGIAPVTERSGDSSWVHIRYRCPTFLRQSFIEWVDQTIPRSYWAEAFYKQRGKLLVLLLRWALLGRGSQGDGEIAAVGWRLMAL